MRTGILLAIVGLWVLLRTVRHDANGQTLADHLLGQKSS